MANDYDDLQKAKNPADDVVDEGVSEFVDTQSPAVSGEEDVSGTAPIPTSDDDTGQMVSDVVGREPGQGETLSDIVNQAERERRFGPDEEPTDEEILAVEKDPDTKDLDTLEDVLISEDLLPRQPRVQRLEDLEPEEKDEEEPEE